MKFKYTFAVSWLIPKENSSYCVLNFHLVWNTSRYERLYVCLFVFMVLFPSSFGSRSEWPRALQLLIKMLISWCPRGLFFLYRNFVFKFAFVFLVWTEQNKWESEVLLILNSLFQCAVPLLATLQQGPEKCFDDSCEGSVWWRGHVGWRCCEKTLQTVGRTTSWRNP